MFIFIPKHLFKKMASPQLEDKVAEACWRLWVFVPDQYAKAVIAAFEGRVLQLSGIAAPQDVALATALVFLIHGSEKGVLQVAVNGQVVAADLLERSVCAQTAPNAARLVASYYQQLELFSRTPLSDIPDIVGILGRHAPLWEGLRLSFGTLMQHVVHAGNNERKICCGLACMYYFFVFIQDGWMGVLSNVSHPRQTAFNWCDGTFMVVTSADEPEYLWMERINSQMDTLFEIICAKFQ
jgi:hypothetical protein